MKNFLTKYFNETTFSGKGVAPCAILGLTSAGITFAAGGVIGIGLGIVLAVLSAGYVNKWQEAATGKLLWKPRTPIFGL